MSFEEAAAFTAVCTTKNLELLASLGADTVIDYTQEDFTKNDQTYDVSFDAAASTRSRGARANSSGAGSSWRPTICRT
jgi:NADPH:quinone reductase-like Zn-dependent oxidoreductase